MRPDIKFPKRDGTVATEVIPGENNIVLLGSNGSGKTRIGAWIEFKQAVGIVVHRISAQRALSIPDSASLQTLEIAEKGLFFGYASPDAGLPYKIGRRWGSHSATHLLSDYDSLLATLFARITKRNNEYAKAAKDQGVYNEVPDSPIDVIVKAWQDIMPQSVIEFDDGIVSVTRPGGAKYHGKEMSDGERVTLYLLGQCLCAPDDSIVIIDEPEIHLHKSLMVRLWNKVEELCPNKVLIYITHDLDFAAARKGAAKFWIKNYIGDDNKWEWDEVPEIDEIPENLTLEIIGSRKDIIFCEGDKGSYDYILYQAVFPNHHIIPRGGCEKVIESTKAFNGNAALHHLHATGIIDGDYRTTPEIVALNGHRIFTINVAEIENLLCIEELIRIVATHLVLDPNTKVAEVTTFIIEALRAEFQTQVSSHAEREIQFRLNSYTKDAATEVGLQNGFTRLVASIDVPAIYERSRALFQEAIDDNSLQKALKIYNRKNLSERISVIFGLGRGEYVNIIFRLLRTDQKPNIVAALNAYIPVI